MRALGLWRYFIKADVDLGGGRSFLRTPAILFCVKYTMDFFKGLDKVKKACYNTSIRVRKYISRRYDYEI